MELLSLHPPAFNIIVYIICPAVAIFQWVIITWLAQKKEVWESLEDIDVAAEYKQKAPFLKDAFFILWNIFPIYLLCVYSYMAMNWSNWKADLLLLNSTDLPAIYDQLNAFRFNKNSFLMLILISLFAALWQFKKQKKLKNEKEKIYWWDIRISKSIFYIRMVALFFNMFSVLYVVFTAIIISIFILSVVKIDHLNLTFFHPDNSGGLMVIGNLSIVLSSVFLFTSGLGLAAIFDHEFKQGLSHTLTDIIAPLFIIPALIILIYPTITNKDRLTNEFHNLNVVAGKILCKDIPDEYQAILIKGVDKNDAEPSDISSNAFNDWLGKNSPRNSALRQILQINYFPINWSMFISLVTTWLAPLFIWIFFNIYSSRKERGFDSGSGPS